MASRVAANTSAALEHGLLKKQPSYYQALLNSKPPTSIARFKMARRSDGLVSEGSTSQRVEGRVSRVLAARERTNAKESAKPQPIEWVQHDRIRSQFYRDHPWEKNRPHVLVEGRQVGEDILNKPTGKDWRELSQRSRLPNATDVVDYTVNLHQSFQIPLEEAYSSCIRQYRALKATHEIANRYAQQEAEAYGAEYTARGFIGAGILAEQKQLEKWNLVGLDGQTSDSATSPKVSLLEAPPQHETEWSGGRDYLRKLHSKEDGQ